MMKLWAKLFSVFIAVMLIAVAFPTLEVGALQFNCNRAQFIRDVTVPDGSHFAPGETFTKTWRLRNVGTCTWTTDYALVFDSGNAFGVSTTQKLVEPVPPWSYVDLTIPNMVAPSTPGRHFSYWKLDNGLGDRFGVGWGAGVPIFAEINVVAPPSVTFDFTDRAEFAAWSSGAGALSFPGTVGDSRGFVIEQANPKFENGVTASMPGLLVAPNNINYGFIQGIYEEYSVKKGDRFQTTVGCAYDTNFCYVAFSLKYQVGTGPIYTLWTFRERYEGLTYSANINLDQLAGKNVKFILHLSAYGPPTGDTAIWGHPVIVGSGAPSGPSTGGWNTYRDSSVPFSFMFPPESTVDISVKAIDLPFAAGTNLSGKYLVINTSTAGAGDCLTAKPDPSAPEDVTFNGITFKKETGLEGADDVAQEWVAYSAKNPAEDTCVSLTFTLSYSAPGVGGTPFNEAAETAVFEAIMSTFSW